MAYDTASFQAGIVAGRALRGRRPGATGGGDVTEFNKAMTDARIELAVISSITMLAYLDFKGGRALRGRRPGATGGGDVTEFNKAMTDARIELAVISSITMLAYLDFKGFEERGTNWELRIVSQSALKVKQGWDECFIMPPTELTLPDTPEYPTIVTMPDISGSYTVEDGKAFTLSRRVNGLDGVSFSEEDNGVKRELVYKGRVNGLDGVSFSEEDNGVKRELVYKGTAYRMALTGAGWEADNADMLWTMRAPIFIPYMRAREV